MNKKLTSLQMIKIIKDKTISKQSKEHKKQVMVFAFGEPFLKSINR